MSYEIQQHTMLSGWTNTFRVEYLDGTTEYETFDSRQEAEAALDEYIELIWEEIFIGECHPDAGDPDRFRVAKAGAS